MKQTDPRDALQRVVAKAGTQGAAAALLGFKQAYINDLLHGRRQFSEKMLAALGLQRVVVKR